MQTRSLRGIRGKSAVNMLRLVFILVANALALLATAYIVPGFHVTNVTTALLASLVLGILNLFLRPILTVLSLPVNVLTLGLFSWVVSALLILLTSFLVPGFKVDGFLAALVGGVLLAFVSSILQSFTY